MDRRPGWSCRSVKFSSSNVLRPHMHVDPVPSPLRKSPPWHMKLAICRPGASVTVEIDRLDVAAGISTQEIAVER